MRRRLRDVGTKVTGALAARLAEVADKAGQAAAQAAGATSAAAGIAAPLPAGHPVPQTGGAGPATTPAGEGTPVTTDLAAAPDAAAPPAAAPPPDVAAVEAPDGVLLAAQDLARAAAVEVGGRTVGEHVGVEAETPAAHGATLTHSFATSDPAYVGWRWAVTLARAEGSDRVTVDEVVLLPGGGALLPPAWLPWADRVEAGDLGAGDLLPPPAGDERLVPAYAEPEAELADEVFWELGLGRPRVLSLDGRADAAERWWAGEPGPDAPVARKAPGRCAGCGFLVPLGGSLRQAFGVCANAYAPDDGRVVALAHGCGAHSETVVDGAHAATAGMAVQDDEFDVVPVTGLLADEADEDLEIEDPAALVAQGLTDEPGDPSP